MKLLLMNEEYPCARAVKDTSAGTVRAYDTQGTMIFEAQKVKDFGLFKLEGGGWELSTPDKVTIPLTDGLTGEAMLKTRSGLVRLLCGVTSQVSAGVRLLVLPEGFRPAEDRTIPAAVSGAAGATVTIHAADGVVRSNAAGAKCWFSDSFQTTF